MVYMETFDVVKIVGNPDAHATSQLYEFALPGTKHLYILLSYRSTDQNIARMETMRGVVNFLHHYFTTETFVFEEAKATIEGSVTSQNFDMVLLFVSGDRIYIFALGEVSVLLLRQGKLHSLARPIDHKLTALSGHFIQGDALCFGTSTFWKAVPEKLVLDSFVNGNISVLDEDSAQNIQANEDHGRAVFALVSMKETGNPHREDLLISPMQIESVKSQTAPVEEFSHEDDLEVALMDDTERIQPTPIRQRLFLRHQDVYQATRRSRKTTAFGVVLLLILGTSVFFGMQAKKEQAEKKRVMETIKSAQSFLAEAKTVAAVNKDRARDLIQEARGLVLGVSDVGSKYPEIKSLSEEVTESLGVYGGLYEQAPKVFIDMTLISPNLKADTLALSDSLLRILSRDEKRITLVELPGKRTENLSGVSEGAVSPKSMFAYAKRTFLLENEGIFEYTGKRIQRLNGPFSEGSLVMSFAGNIYVLDQAKNAIFRYAGSGDGYGSESSWLSPGVEIDLSRASSWAVDGAIWVLSSSGKLVRFTIGNPQNVTLKRQDTPSDKATIYTSDVSKHLYLLDPESKSLDVFEKDGAFVASYKHESLSSATSFVVSEEHKIAAIASGDKVLSLDLTHIRE